MRKTSVFEERDPSELLAVRRPQHVDLDHRRFLRVDLHRQLQGALPSYAAEDHFLVRRQDRLADVLVIAP